ncbi:MAG: hypothetical protein KF908_10105 [Nitrosomonas sp.]|nr:hypothetical protein [Nitrosomonas sp.]MCW5608899.1 hypothetical protein [Nitrosomonas sp.]
MRSRFFIILSIIFICATFVLPTPVVAQNNNFYMQQQMMRNQQMMQQQQMRQQQMQQQQMRQQQMREQQMRQQRIMHERQQQMQRQQQAMRERQQQAMRQRQQMAERQRQMQQQRQNNLQRKQETQGQKRIQGQQRRQQQMRQQQMLRQQGLMKDRQKRLYQLQQQRIHKQRADNKKKNTRDTLTMAMLLRQQAKPSLVNTRPNQKQSVKQFQQTRLQQQKQQRVTKQFETKRKAAQVRMQKIRLAQKQFQNKKLAEKKRQQQKQTQTQKLAQANFGSCKGGVCACSFDGNTLVLTKNGFVPIASLDTDMDFVWARNEYTGDVDWKPVIAHYSNPYQETVTVNIWDAANGETQSIISNRIHPFYVSHSETNSTDLIAGTNDTGRWIQAQDLQPGDMLLTDSGSPAEVVDLEIKSEPLQAYNITVDEYHTYFVKGVASDNAPAIWVHNDCHSKKQQLTREVENGEWRLIGANKAKIDSRKLTKYALKVDHPVGGHKARVFQSALGFNQSNANDLLKQLKKGVMNNTPVAGKVDKFGSRFTVDIPVTGPAGSGIIRTGWIYRTGSDTPELTTLFVK